MRELREDAFSGNKNDDAHEHIERVLDIISLFNIPGVTRDAVMLRVFLITLTGAAKRIFATVKQEGDEDIVPAWVSTWKNRHKEVPKWKNGQKRYRESRKINTRNQGASLKNLETQIEQLTKEFHAKAATEVPTSSVGQCKAVYDDAPIYNTSSNETNDIHGVSFINVQEGDDLPSEGLPCQLPPKEINSGSFTLPFTIGSLNFYVMADLRASVNDGEPCKIITPPPHKSPLCLELDGNCNLHNRNNNTPDNDGMQERCGKKARIDETNPTTPKEKEDALSLGRENGSRFREIVRKELVADKKAQGAT
ncbi:hypothetical protein Tco_0795664 [Tanacetum coccineum]